MTSRAKQGIRDFALVIRAFSLFHIPDAYSSPSERIPQALRFFPLWGAVSGGLLWAAAWVLYPGFFRVSALVLLAMDLLLGGACLLQQLMLFADRRALPEEQKKASLFRSPAALLSAVFWLLLLYGGYYAFLRSGNTETLFFAQVYSRWFFCFAVRLAKPAPASSRKEGFTPRAFLFASLTAGLCLLPGYSLPMVLSILCSALILFFFRGTSRRDAGCLPENAYGAFAALAQIIFLWGCFSFGNI